jgi:hypothetical protein
MGLKTLFTGKYIFIVFPHYKLNYFLVQFVNKIMAFLAIVFFCWIVQFIL